MTKNTVTPSDVIVRIYEVVLMPDADTSYDPFTVSLSWPVAVAHKLDRDDPKVIAEAFDRAVKVEMKTHTTGDGTSFQNGGVTFIRERLIPAGQTRQGRR